jgi:hypothetical protein
VTRQESAFLEGLKREARAYGAEFQRLLDDCAGFSHSDISRR